MMNGINRRRFDEIHKKLGIDPADPTYDEQVPVALFSAKRNRRVGHGDSDVAGWIDRWSKEKDGAISLRETVEAISRDGSSTVYVERLVPSIQALLRRDRSKDPALLARNGLQRAGNAAEEAGRMAAVIGVVGTCACSTTTTVTGA